MRRVAAIAVLTLLSQAWLVAEPEVQRYFGTLQQTYRFVQLEELVGSEAAAATRFGPGILAEARLESLSRWRLEGASIVLLLDVYQLADPSGAYQLFSHWSGPEPAGGARIDADEGLFRQGRFLFRVRSGGNGPLPAAFGSFRQDLSNAIPGENTLPVSISHLPENGRDAASVRYYLGPASLSVARDFPEPLVDSVGLDDQAEVASARYPSTETTLFIIAYPTPALARDYFVSIQQRLDGFFSSRGLYLTRSGPLVALLAGPERGAKIILDQVRYDPTIEWIHDVRAENAAAKLKGFLGLVADRLMAIGMALVLMVGTGLIVGVVRYEMIRRFPILTARSEMIRLNLDKSA